MKFNYTRGLLIKFIRALNEVHENIIAVFEKNKDKIMAAYEAEEAASDDEGVPGSPCHEEEDLVFPQNEGALPPQQTEFANKSDDPTPSLCDYKCPDGRRSISPYGEEVSPEVVPSLNESISSKERSPIKKEKSDSFYLKLFKVLIPMIIILLLIFSMLIF